MGRLARPASSREMVLAARHAFRLRSLGARVLDELHRGARLEVLELGMQDVLAAEIQFPAVVRRDEPVTLAREDARDGSLLGPRVRLDVAALLADDVLQLARDRAEGVAKRDVDVLVVLPVGDDLR